MKSMNKDTAYGKVKGPIRLIKTTNTSLKVITRNPAVAGVVRPYASVQGQ